MFFATIRNRFQMCSCKEILFIPICKLLLFQNAKFYLIKNNVWFVHHIYSSFLSRLEKEFRQFYKSSVLSYNSDTPEITEKKHHMSMSMY